MGDSENARKARKGKTGAKPIWDKIGMANKLDLIEGWARQGATDENIYNALHVSADTFYRWKKDKPEFAAALMAGKEIADIKVENALYNRAIGYDVTEQTEELFAVYDEIGNVKRDDNGEIIERLKVTKRVKKHIHGDTTAQIFWLKNRRPDRWRDAKNINLNGNLGVKDYDYMTDEELQKEIDKLEGVNNEQK